MQRCTSHELQTWTVDGRTADAGTVRSLLKDVFVETRGQRRSILPVPAQKVGRVQAPSYERASSDVDLDAGDRLTALLRFRGLQGTWAVA